MSTTIREALAGSGVVRAKGKILWARDSHCSQLACRCR